MESLITAVDEFERRGFITPQEQQDFIAAIQEDGVVDEVESDQLSRLFSLIDRGKIRIVEKEQLAEERTRERRALEQRRAEKASSERAFESIRMLLEEAKRAGRMSHDDHDALMSKIHADGVIDERESQLLSELHALLKSGEITLEESVEEKKLRRKAAEARFRDESRAPRADSSKETGSGAFLQPVSENQASSAGLPPEPNPEPADQEPAEDEGIPGATYSFAEFARVTKERRDSSRAFQLETDRFLNVLVNGHVWIKTGSMIAYTGRVKFTREGVMEHGATRMLKRAFTSEGTALTKASGSGTLFLADKGKKVSIIDLKGDSVIVKGENLLAFEPSVLWNIILTRSAASVLAGGMFNVRLGGRGMIAITTHYDPVVLVVRPGESVMTDPSATIAWSGSITPRFHTDVSVKTLVGRTSGETVQMEFSGEGFVVVQPFEEQLVQEQ